MKREHAIFKELARALDRLAIRVYSTEEFNAAEMEASLDALESDFLARIQGTRSQLEIKRRISERKLVLLAERNVPFSEFQPTIARLRDLGFADLERRATFEIVIADYYLANGRLTEAKQLLELLRAGLAKSINTQASPLYKEFINNVDRRLAGIA